MKVQIDVSTSITSLEPVLTACTQSAFDITSVNSSSTLGFVWANMRNIELTRSDSITELRKDSQALIAVWDGTDQKLSELIRAGINKKIPVFVFNSKINNQYWFNTIKPITKGEVC